MDVKNVKSPLTHREQLAKIVARGCMVDDENEAISILEQINYYRLTAYFLPFKREDNTYKAGTNFNSVYQIHEFDRELSRLIFSVIVSIELRLRAQIVNYHAHKYGALGYTDENNFKKRHNHEKFIESIERNIKNNKRQLFVKHHIENYDGKFPIWAIIELFSLGDLSFFFSDMKPSDKKNVAKLYNTSYKNLSSWLLCLTNLRNYCAHYSRLYYNTFAAQPATPENFPYTLRKRIFDYILVLKFLYCSDEKWNSSFVVPLEALIEKYQGHIQLKHIAFPKNWLDLLRKPYFVPLIKDSNSADDICSIEKS
jgi:abortive infection bacteriophage resistance protein